MIGSGRKYQDEAVAIIDKNDVVHMAHMDIHYGFLLMEWHTCIQRF